jgi:HK97 family phage portal protein
MSPLNIEILPADTGLVKSYRYRGMNGGFKDFPSNPVTGDSQVFHYYNPTYEDAFWGEPKAKAAATWLDASNEGAKWNTALLQNGAQPSGALYVEGELTTEQKSKLRETWEARYSGARNAGMPLVMSSKMKWEEMGKTPKDMDFQATLNYADRKIADAFGIPFPLISPDAATFANQETARESVYEDVIIPYFNTFLERFGDWLLSKYPDTKGMALKADYDDIPAFEDKRARKYDRAVKAVQDGLLSINEAREMFDYEPVEGGDVILVNAGKIPLTVAADDSLTTDDNKIDAALNEKQPVS